MSRQIWVDFGENNRVFTLFDPEENNAEKIKELLSDYKSKLDKKAEGEYVIRLEHRKKKPLELTDENLTKKHRGYFLRVLST